MIPAVSSPIILSASRSTDIPAFYSKWLKQRLLAGYSVWINPFNRKPLRISWANVRFIVFWSKNPVAFLKERIPEILDKLNIGWYLHYTLNDYEYENFERNIPALAKRIELFEFMAKKYGSGRIIWRFDPLILSSNPHLTYCDLLRKISGIAAHLSNFTERLIFSFFDPEKYICVKRTFSKNHICANAWPQKDIFQFAAELAAMNRQWNMALHLCAGEFNLEEYGIAKSACIDGNLVKRFAKDHELVAYLESFDAGKQLSLNLPEKFKAQNSSYPKDKNQRKHCGCMQSKDIGSYNTCTHNCMYCYANSCHALAAANNLKHDPYGEHV